MANTVGTGTPLAQWLSTWLKPQAGDPPAAPYDQQLAEASRVWQGQAPTGKPFQERLLPEGTVPLAQEQAEVRNASQVPPKIFTQEDAFAGEEDTGYTPSVGQSLAPPQPMSTQMLPAGALSQNDALKAALIQLGLGLITPRHGGLGLSLGEASQAYVRARGGNKEKQREEQTYQLETQKTQAEIEAAKALTENRRESSATTRAKRAKGNSTTSTEFERFVQALDLGPKGALFLKEQLESFGEDVFADDSVPLDQQFNEIVEKAKLLDSGGGTGETTESEGVNPNTGKPFEIGDEYPLDDGTVLVLKAFPATDQNNWEPKE